MPRVVGDLSAAAITAAGEVLVKESRVIVLEDPDILMIYTLDRRGLPVLTSTPPYTDFARRSPKLFEFEVGGQTWQIKGAGGCGCGSSWNKATVSNDLRALTNGG